MTGMQSVILYTYNNIRIYSADVLNGNFTLYNGQNAEDTDIFSQMLP